FVVVRAVFRRAPVLRAASARDQLKVLALLHVGRAFEHHMLEQVRESRAAGPLVPGAGVVPHVHGNDGGRMVLRVEDAQPVGKGEGFVGDRADLGARAGGEKQQASDHGRDAHTTWTHTTRAPLPNGTAGLSRAAGPPAPSAPTRTRKP